MINPLFSSSLSSRCGVYAITDADLMPDDDTLLRRVESALKGGIALLQYRDKSTDKTKREHQARELLTLCNRYDVPLIINDDVDLAELLGVGVHLGQEDGSIALARARLGDKAIIGATCHASMELARKAKAEGANYLAFGRFFASRTKPDAPPADMKLLADAKVLGVPIVAIGGIDMTNAAQVVQAGADYIAVVHAVFANEQADEAVARLNKAIGV